MLGVAAGVETPGKIPRAGDQRMNGCEEGLGGVMAGQTQSADHI